MTQAEQISQAIATVERQISEAKSDTAKKVLGQKLERLKEDLKKAKPSLSTLPKARKQVKALNKSAFQELVEKLSKKPEYAFLKEYSQERFLRDKARTAKPKGYRFKGDNDNIPTADQVKKGLKDGTVYYEGRPIRSDISREIRLEKGGSIASFNWNNFTLKELNEALPTDVEITYFNTPEKKFNRPYFENKKLFTTKRLTISQHGEAIVSKGSENIYLDIKCYNAEDKNDMSEYEVSIYTKENHSGLKEVAKSLIEKMKLGGNVKTDLKALWDKTVDIAKKGYDKTKEVSKKKIHDGKKAIAIDVINETKGKVGKTDKSELNKAKSIIVKKFADGGTVKFRKLAKSNNFDIVVSEGRYEVELDANNKVKSIVHPSGERHKASECPIYQKYKKEINEYLTERFADGGSVGKDGAEKGYNVFNYTDNIYATDKVFKTKKLANDFIKEFRKRFEKQGYYRDNQMNKIAVKDIDLLAIPSDFSPFRKFAKGGGVDNEHIIISSYWSNEEDEKRSEKTFKEYIKNNPLKNVWIGYNKIDNFKFDESDGRMIMKYALRKNANLKYYVSFLNHSVALKQNNAVFLEDKNYEDYDNKILTKETLELLNTKNIYAKGGGVKGLKHKYYQTYVNLNKGFDLIYFDDSSDIYGDYKGTYETIELAKEQAKKDGYTSMPIYNRYAEGGNIDSSYLGTTRIGKGYYGWTAKTTTKKQINGYDWEITTMKRSSGDLVSSANGGKAEQKEGYSTFMYSPFEDPSLRLISSKPKMVNEKAVTKQHEEALKIFIEKLNEMKSDKMATGGNVGEKVYNVMHNVGKAKYVVNFHDGVKTHSDGSRFFDIEIFKNLKGLKEFTKKLDSEGYKKQMKYGGSLNSEDTSIMIYAQTLSYKTGLQASAIKEFTHENNLSDDELLNIVQGIGTKKLSVSDLVTAVSGKKGNKSAKEVIAFAKSDEAFKKMATGGGVKASDKKFKEVEDLGSEQYYTRYFGTFGTEKGEIELVVVAKITDLEGYVSEDELPAEGNFQLSFDIVPKEEFISEDLLEQANDEDSSVSDDSVINIVNYMGGLRYEPSEKVHFKTHEKALKHLMSIPLNKEINRNGEYPDNVIYSYYNRAGATNEMYLDYLIGVSDKFFKNGGNVGKSKKNKYLYIPNQDISKIVLKSKQVIGKDRILDGAYVKDSKKAVKFTEKYKFPIGSVVWDKTHKTYGVVLNNYGDEVYGSHDEIRLDSDGNQNIHTYDKKWNNNGYNLVPYGSEEDKGDGDLTEAKESATRLIEMNSKRKQDAEQKKYYEEAYKDLLSGKIDGKPYKANSEKVIGKTSTGKSIYQKYFSIPDLSYEELKEASDIHTKFSKKAKTEEEKEMALKYAREFRRMANEEEFAKGLGKYATGGNISDEVEQLWRGYASAILFAETDYDTDEPLEYNYSISDFDEETEKESKKLLTKFYKENKKAIEESGLDLDTIGNNVWYTRAGHGAGFFDHSLDSDVEEALTKGAKALGEMPDVETYDGKISVRGGRVFKYATGGSVSTYYNDMSEEEILKQTVVYDNGGKTLDRYTVFTPDGSVYGMSDTASGFNQYVGEESEIEKGKHLGRLLKKVPTGIKSAVLDRMKEEFGGGGSMYAKGGSMESKKVYIYTGYNATATKDDYEEGELETVGDWDINERKTFNSKKELIDYINENIIYSDYEETDFDWETGEGRNVQTDVLCSYDDYNGYFPASESDKALWKKGKKTLYNVHYWINVMPVIPTEFKRGGNTNYSYIENDKIDRIITNSGKEYGSNVILDGAYVTDKVRTPKMSRTQFEDDGYSYGEGGEITPEERQAGLKNYPKLNF